MVDDQRQIAEMIAGNSQRRRALYEQLNSPLQSSILGTLDIVNPDSKAQFKLNDFSDYHYLSNEGRVYNANSPDASALGVYREMLALP